MEATKRVGAEVGVEKVKELTPNCLPPLFPADTHVLSLSLSLPIAAPPIPLSLTMLSVQEEAGWCILMWLHTPGLYIVTLCW